MKVILACFVVTFLLKVAQSASMTASSERSDCQACEYIVNFVRFQTLSQAQSVDAVKEKLEALFKIIPFSVQNKEYLSNVEGYVRMIRDGKDPQSICKLLSKCSPAEQPESADLPRITECEVCTAVVDLIKLEIMVSNATIEVIIDAIQALCAILGDVPVYEECKLILKDLEEIIQLIEEKITPKDICIKLGFCNQTIATLTLDYVKTQLLRWSKSSSLCDLCKMVVQMVDGKLESFESRLDDIESILNDVCSALGDDIAQQCKSLVDSVLDELEKNLENIEAQLDPSTTCKALHLCTAESLANAV